MPDWNPFHYLFPADDPMHDFDPFSEESNGIIKWYNDVKDYWKTARGKYQSKAILYSLPIIGDWAKANDAMQEMDDTLALLGLTYDDIIYAWKTIGFQALAGASSSGFNYISSNINRLYR